MGENSCNLGRVTFFPEAQEERIRKEDNKEK
jgi:hypothetical protein